MNALHHLLELISSSLWVFVTTAVGASIFTFVYSLRVYSKFQRNRLESQVELIRVQHATEEAFRTELEIRDLATRELAARERAIVESEFDTRPHPELVAEAEKTSSVSTPDSTGLAAALQLQLQDALSMADAIATKKAPRVRAKHIPSKMKRVLSQQISGQGTEEGAAESLTKGLYGTGSYSPS